MCVCVHIYVHIYMYIYIYVRICVYAMHAGGRGRCGRGGEERGDGGVRNQVHHLMRLLMKFHFFEFGVCMFHLFRD